MNEELIQKNKEISKLKKDLNTFIQKNKQLEKNIVSLKDSPVVVTEKNLVYVDVLSNTPHCKQHGAMLCMNEERTIWRCPACNVGMLYIKFRGISREEVRKVEEGVSVGVSVSEDVE